MMKHLTMILVFVMTLNSSVAAQVSTKGLAALEAYDYATALEELLPLAEQGDARAQSFLGGMYALGTGVLQDYAEAVKWYRLAAEQGDQESQFFLGWDVNGIVEGNEQDYESVKWFEDFYKGLAALEAYDYATALEELLPLAEQGDARAQSFLGGMYALGTGVLQDYAEAVKWYRLAAEQGNVSAQVSLAFAFHSGAGVEQDYFAAVKWFSLAARQESAIAQFQLALMYKRGTGVAQENIKSYMWFSIASTNSDIHKNKHNRDKTAAKMTSADISKAQSMARECMSSGYTKCGY